MPDLNHMRQDLYSRYPGKAWKLKVDDMPDDQIIALWYSMREREQKPRVTNQPKQKSKDDDAIQLPLL